MLRMLGVLLVCGALVAGVGLLLSARLEIDTVGLWVVGGIALTAGGASLLYARHARPWTVHTVFAAGTALVCLGIYFSGTATGAYSLLFVWLVVIAASFFTPQAIAVHVLWILVSSGVALALVEQADGVSAFVRWWVGSLLLIVAATAMSRIVAGRRAVEDRLRREIQEKESLQRELEHLAHHDPLTGLANRRRLEQELSRELSRAERSREPLCVVALDLDDLKSYNDTHGHAAGDRLLKQAASNWMRALRGTDLIARMGGDEFVAVLPDCPHEEADQVVARLRQDESLGRSCSAGVACWDGRESADELLRRADDAMYATKLANQRNGNRAA